MSEGLNILLILTDQQRADHVGFGGNALVRTPHLDALANAGAVFTRAHVANPICMPNRSSIFTGRLPSVHGTRVNGIALHPGAETFARVLRRAGYDTAYFGKCHLQNMGVGAGHVGRFLANTHAGRAVEPPGPPGWDRYEDMQRHRGAERVAMPDDYYGFAEVDLVVGHSDGCSGHYWQWLLEQGVDPQAIQGRERALSGAITRQSWRTATPVELYPTTYVTLQAKRFLQRRAEQAADAPFLAVASYPDPHHAFTPPGRYFDLYDPADVALPATYDDPHTRSMPHYQRLRAARGQPPLSGVAPFSPTEAELREMTAREYGMIALIDDGVGQLLATLERTGLAERTAVIFTSDHGDMFGDHGMMLKFGMHYAGCIRVPLVVRAPGVAAGSRAGLVSSLDLAPTCLSIAGQEPFHGMQGVDLTPLLQNPTASVRDETLIEEDAIFDLLGIGRPLRMRTLVTQRARLTVYDGHPHGELFDLERDPDELDNLFGLPDARALQSELTERLARALMAAAETSPKPDAVA